ncbi:MAG TPA: zf-HC2 domain-containing protein [Bryobacteraceae bacterium]|jgi:anti-sigma factor RsiW
MNCAEFESTLADYVDGTLDAGGRARLEAHMASCSGCREMFEDVRAATAFLARVPEVEPPDALITRIAYQAPTGRIRGPWERQGFLSRLASKWMQPILQPRLVMGMAMTVLSFAMLERCTGVKVQNIQAADLSPVRIWGGMEDRAVRLKDRVVKSYENLRVVYEIETRLKDLEQQQETYEERPQRPSSGSTRGSSGSTRGSGERQGNSKEGTK